jgi:hypothetical protein
MADDDTTQGQLDEVYRAAKEQPVDAILPLLHDALTDEELSSHTVYAWAEDISAGIPPRA